MLATSEEGLAHARAAVAIFRALGDVRGEALGRAASAWLLLELGDPEALEEGRLGLGLATATADPETIGWANQSLGLVYAAARQGDLAIRHLHAARRAARAAGHQTLEGRALVNLGLAHLSMAEDGAKTSDHQAGRAAHLADAALFTAEGLALARATSDDWIARIAVCNLAEITCDQGRPEEGLALLDREPAPVGELAALDHAHRDHARSLCLLRLGRLAEAGDALVACLAQCERSDTIFLRVQATEDLAHVLEAQGRLAEALAAHRGFHALYVRQASDGAERRARAAGMTDDAALLARQVTAEQALVARLAASNQALATQAFRLLKQASEAAPDDAANRLALEAVLASLGAETPHAVLAVGVDALRSDGTPPDEAARDGFAGSASVALRGALRETDCVAATGKRAFAVVRLAQAADAPRFAARIRSVLEDWAEARSDAATRVVISLGAASSEEAPTARDALALADARRVGRAG